jgi:hypothetical protein
MAVTADSFMGIIISLMFFALGVATVAVANRGTPKAKFGTDSSGEPITTTVIIKDYPNIVFGSLFIFLSVTIFAMAVRAMMS